MNDGMREAEIGVLGAALLDPVRVLGILSRWGVTPEWWGTDQGQKIAETLLPMHAEGRPIDLITVCEEMHRRKLPNLIPVVEACFDKVPTAAHAEHYVALLRDAWMQRAARAASAEMSKGFEEAEWAPQAVLSKAISRLTALVEATAKGMARSSWEVKRELVTAWQDAADGKRSAMGLPWPYQAMTKLTCGIYPGVNVIAARPSVGKTMFEGELVRNLLMKGYRVARASLDMGVEPLVARDLCSLAGESLNKMRGGFMTASDRTKLELTLEAMREWKETVLEDRTSEAIIARARALNANGGLDLLTVDYAQLLNVGENGRDNDNVRIAKAMAQLKEFSLTTKVPVVILSQLSREVEKEGRRPQLSDLRDSGSIEQDAATVVFLYAEPKVAKRWMERQGVTDMKQLAVRPVVWDLLKNQQGSTGTVALRQWAKYFAMEQAAADGGGAGEDAACGFDFSRPERPTPADPDLNGHVIAKHPKGAVEFFTSAWFAEVNKAAARLGVDGYAEVARAAGIAEAAAEMEKTRAWREK